MPTSLAGGAPKALSGTLGQSACPLFSGPLAAWRPAHAHLKGGGWSGWDSLLFSLVWCLGGVGGGSETPAQKSLCVPTVWACTVCLCVWQSPCERGRKRGGRMTLQGRAAPHTSASGRGHRYPISGVTGNRIGPLYSF